MDFKLKYLKYKSKYINLKKQLGSGSLEIIPSKEGKGKQQTEQLVKGLKKAGFKTKKDVFKKFRSNEKKGGAKLYLSYKNPHLDNGYVIATLSATSHLPSAYDTLMRSSRTQMRFQRRPDEEPEHPGYNITLRKLYREGQLYYSVVVLDDGEVTYFLSNDKNELGFFLENQLGATNMIAEDDRYLSYIY